MAVAREAIFDQQRHLLRQAQSHLVRETACFAEVDEVLQGEREGDWLGEADRDIVVGLFDVGVLT